jgi:lysophospholipase L1-like esterase
MNTDNGNAYSSMVALGDSFTEGMSDELPDGGYRGWADLVAARLAQDAPGFGYANLAVRGKLVGQIHAEQLAPARAMRADLAFFAGGMNDVMRPGCDLDAVTGHVRAIADGLAETAGRLVLFRVINPSRRMRGSARIMPRVHRLIAAVDELAVKHGAIVVDLFSSGVFDAPALWAEDRIHLNAEGHRRVAEAVLVALGHARSFDWQEPVVAEVVPFGVRVRSDLRWARRHLAPWVGRRLRGRSSGDGREPKRPDLLPYG